MSMPDIPPGVIIFGADENCNLNNCPIEWSLYGYRPWLSANTVFLVLFAIVGLVHAYLGYRWRSWGFMVGMLLGCLCEVIGYAGRMMLWYNPFSYPGFMIQIVCLTIAPVFFTASIYVTLSKSINYFAPDLSRFKPQLFYYIFIPFDIVCLILQAIGGAMSTQKAGTSDQTGVDISKAGLILQVIVLTAFMAAFADYMVRYIRSARFSGFGWRLKTFFAGLTVAALLVLTRCVYRVAELKDGYSGDLIKEQVPFIILEGLVIVLAAIALCFGHPGLVFDREDARGKALSDGEGLTTLRYEK